MLYPHFAISRQAVGRSARCWVFLRTPARPIFPVNRDRYALGTQRSKPPVQRVENRARGGAPGVVSYQRRPQEIFVPSPPQHAHRRHHYAMSRTGMPGEVPQFEYRPPVGGAGGSQELLDRLQRGPRHQLLGVQFRTDGGRGHPGKGIVARPHRHPGPCGGSIQGILNAHEPESNLGDRRCSARRASAQC